ncbi:hypothetical protein DFH28DRAFT_1081348 [Melampsora americana]|nr:hypothetical protein DFH28DRAFT_1081348 [Melampsora americana]
MWESSVAIEVELVRFYEEQKEISDARYNCAMRKLDGSQPTIPLKSNLLKNGQLATSVRAQNRAVANWLPPHYSGYCHAILEFTRYLLDISDSFPPPPTKSELASLPTLSDHAIFGNTAILWGVLEQWLRGQAVEQAKTFLQFLHSVQLFLYRKKTIETYLGTNALKYLPAIHCCSDTVDSPWREDLYVEWLHTVNGLSIDCVKEMRGEIWAAQQLAAQRKRATPADPQALISSNLPAECCRRTLELNIPDTERYLLINRNSQIESLESLLTRTRKLLK